MGLYKPKPRTWWIPQSLGAHAVLLAIPIFGKGAKGPENDKELIDALQSKMQMLIKADGGKDRILEEQPIPSEERELLEALAEEEWAEAIVHHAGQMGLLNLDWETENLPVYQEKALGPHNPELVEELEEEFDLVNLLALK